MTRARRLAVLSLLACTPHEHPREPQPPCPTGMALVGGGDGVPGPVCFDLTEVTTAAYGACVHAGACTPAVLPPADACNLTHGDRGAHPINCVTLDQAQSYCAWLGKRIPSDDEWSHAARPRLPGSVYPWGRDLDDTHACTARPGTCPTGERPAGASLDGLLDLVGNVAEWTLADRSRLRGGSFRDLPDLVPGEHEIAPDPSPASGFRCVIAPHTPVVPVDLDVWTPHKPGPVELPILAAPTPIAPPTRPLANLAILHRSPYQRHPDRWWRIGDTYLPTDTTDTHPFAHGDPIDRAALPEALREFTPLRDLGDAVLMTAGWSNNLRYIALDRSDATIRWQLGLAPHGASYQQFIAPSALVAEIYGDGVDAVLAFSLATGREVWRISGGPDRPFTRIKHLWTDGARGYLHTDRGLSAFDPATGAIAWQDVAVDEGCGVATGDGALVVETADGRGHRRLDPATGRELARIGALARTCAWGKSPYDDGVTPGVIASGRLIAFDPPDRRGNALLRAHDLAAGELRWTRAGLAREFLLADHDAVYATRTGESVLALDAATGDPQVEISIGGEFTLDVHAGGGDHGPLVVVTAHGIGAWILGRAEQPAVPESFRIRGRLVPDGVRRGQLAGVPVRAGERRVRTDAAGRFTVQGRAIGALLVALGNERGPGEPGGSTVRFEPVHVPLDGRGTYDVGDIALYPWYTE